MGFKPSTFCQAVALTLVEHEVAFVWRDPEEVLPALRHPFGKVPILVSGQEVIFETVAIMTYIEDSFGGPLTRLEEPARYLNLQWVSFYLSYFVPAILDASVRARFVLPMFGIPVDEGAIKQAIPTMVQCMDRLESAVANAPFVAGQEVSMADLLMIPTMIYFEKTPEGKHIISRLPSTARWLARMKNRRSVREVCRSMSRS